MTVGDFTELKSLMNPPQDVKTCLIWFMNFYGFGDNRDNTWATVKKGMANPKQVVAQLQTFNYDTVSGPTVKKIKTLELYDPDAIKAKSAAC